MTEPLRRVGFFADLPLGFMWQRTDKEPWARTVADPPSHSGMGHRTIHYTAAMGERLADYLDAGAVVTSFPWEAMDVLDDSAPGVPGLGLRTDGAWLWPSELGYYVRRYGVPIDAAFIIHAQGREWHIDPPAGRVAELVERFAWLKPEPFRLPDLADLSPRWRGREPGPDPAPALSEARRTRKAFERRQELASLPMVPLTRIDGPRPLADPRWWDSQANPVIGRAGDTLVAVWPSPDGDHEGDHLVQWYSADGRQLLDHVVLHGAIRIGLVTPLPDGSIAVASTRNWQPMTGQVWSRQGTLLAEANLGDAIELLQATNDGHLWVGYFDEALSSTAPEGTPGALEGVEQRTNLLELTWSSFSLDHPDRQFIVSAHALTALADEALVMAWVHASDALLLRLNPVRTRSPHSSPATCGERG